jgi:hypothetical protein
VTDQTTVGQTQFDPASVCLPIPALALVAATATTVADLNFQNDPGWTVTNDASLTTGAWGRGVPVAPTPSNAPASDYDGSGQCWLTDNRPDGASNFDVDGGPTTLTTSAYDLSAYGDALISYARWIQSVNGVTDSMVVQVSNNNGGSWTTVETVPSTSGWVFTAFKLSTFMPVSSQVRVRFVVSDNPNDSVTEGGVDAFRIIGFSCVAPPACYANCDASTTPPVVNTGDFTCFLQQYSSAVALPAAQQQTHYANCDGSTTFPQVNTGDFTCFLQKYAAGCT